MNVDFFINKRIISFGIIIIILVLLSYSVISYKKSLVKNVSPNISTSTEPEYKPLSNEEKLKVLSEINSSSTRKVLSISAKQKVIQNLSKSNTISTASTTEAKLRILNSFQNK